MVGGSGQRGITGPDLRGLLYSLVSTLYSTLSKRDVSGRFWVEGVHKLARWLGYDCRLWQHQGQKQGHQLEGYSQSSRQDMVGAWTKEVAVRGGE